MQPPVLWHCSFDLSFESSYKIWLASLPIGLSPNTLSINAFAHVCLVHTNPFCSHQRRLLLFFHFLELSATHRGLLDSLASLLHWEVLTEGNPGHGLVSMGLHACLAWALASYVQTGESLGDVIMTCGAGSWKAA